jgi:hypothetical protein
MIRGYTAEFRTMKKKPKSPRVYVELTAVWGNDDADSTIKVSRRRWKQIQDGAEYETGAWSWYEGKRYSVSWRFAEGEVSVYGGDGMECVVGLPVADLIVQTTETDAER